ncbi:MAG TPA: ABC transporter ATP-binding protein, partial [Arachnia sp.]|nr:ABC transporter ATP-binding protein [Arachnia sp.]
MSEKTEVTEKKANERPKFGPGARRGPGGGGPGGHMVAGEKAVNFLPSVKRLMGNLRPVRALVIIAIAIGTLSVALSVVGPKILGRATDMMLAGIIGSHEWPPGATKQSIIDGLVAQGNTQMADMLRNLDF